MTWWHRARALAPRRRSRMEDQLEKELRFHLDEHAAGTCASGPRTDPGTRSPASSAE